MPSLCNATMKQLMKNIQSKNLDKEYKTVSTPVNETQFNDYISKKNRPKSLKSCSNSICLFEVKGKKGNHFCALW